MCERVIKNIPNSDTIQRLSSLHHGVKKLEKLESGPFFFKVLLRTFPPSLDQADPKSLVQLINASTSGSIRRGHGIRACTGKAFNSKPLLVSGQHRPTSSSRTELVIVPDWGKKNKKFSNIRTTSVRAPSLPNGFNGKSRETVCAVILSKPIILSLTAEG